LKVSKSINTLSTTIIVDTETSISLIEGDFFDYYLRENVTLILAINIQVMATNGQPMTIRGMIHVQLNLGAKKEA
jgi:hypothetical protein